jgi:hypothetical protein
LQIGDEEWAGVAAGRKKHIEHDGLPAQFAQREGSPCVVSEMGLKLVQRIRTKGWGCGQGRSFFGAARFNFGVTNRASERAGRGDDEQETGGDRFHNWRVGGRG